MTSTDLGVDDPLELIRVDQTGPGVFSGQCIDGAIGRVFGGHVLAQAIRAASAATGDRRPIDAVHVSFVRPALPDEPLTYRTDVAKSGRALDVVGVRVEQHGATTLLGFVSTHEPEPSVEFADSMPSVSPPDALSGSDYRPQGTNPGVRAPFELRYIPPAGLGGPREQVWIRTRADVHSDLPSDHAALLAYGVDFLVTRAAYPGMPSTMALRGASLDHAMWFHRPFRVDEWLLLSSNCSTYADSRSLATCEVFDTAGRLVATASQEALIRLTNGRR